MYYNRYFHIDYAIKSDYTNTFFIYEINYPLVIKQSTFLLLQPPHQMNLIDILYTFAPVL